MPRRLQVGGILAVTHKDAVQVGRDRERLEARLAAEARPYFRSQVMIAATGAERALRNSQDPAGDDSWQQSGGAELEAQVLKAVAGQLARRVDAAERMLNRAAKRLDVGAQPALAA